jgi:hypothetical protein
MDAAKFGRAEIAQVLIERGADVNAVKIGEDAGWNPLMFAAWQGKTELVKLLLDHSADINSKTGDDWTAIMYAARAGHEDVVTCLIEAGAEINLRTNKGYNALGLAAYNGYLSIVKQLVEAGADVNSRDFDGETPLDDARGQNHVDILEYLLAHGAKGQTDNKKLVLLERYLSAMPDSTQIQQRSRFETVEANFEFGTWVPKDNAEQIGSVAMGKAFVVWGNIDATSAFLYGAGIVESGKVAETIVWLRNITAPGEKGHARVFQTGSDERIIEFDSSQGIAMYETGNLVRNGYGNCAICGKKMRVSVSLMSKGALTCNACGLSICWEHDRDQMKRQPCPKCKAVGMWQNISVD